MLSPCNSPVNTTKLQFGSKTSLLERLVALHPRLPQEGFRGRFIEVTDPGDVISLTTNAMDHIGPSDKVLLQNPFATRTYEISVNNGNAVLDCGFPPRSVAETRTTELPVEHYEVGPNGLLLAKRHRIILDGETATWQGPLFNRAGDRILTTSESMDRTFDPYHWPDIPVKDDPKGLLTGYVDHIEQELEAGRV